ncbi:MAG: response regulator [Silvanigrellaceae bacterium]|nr:response regulator [Silvanigrellaceae bacterium]
MSLQEKAKQLLIIEDDEGFQSSLALEFKDRGFNVTVCSNLDNLMSLIPTDFQFAIIDLRLGQDNGLKAVEWINHHTSSQCRIVVLTGYPSLATAVQAVKSGAVNYLTKPINMNQLESALFEEIDENSTLEEPKHLDLLDNDKGAFESLAKHEREYIEYVLNECQGNISAAAKKLGLHRQSLQRKLKKYPPRN